MKLPISLALAVGALLGAAPFLRYTAPGHAVPHANHDPRHGGQLVMVGDFHLELVARDGAVELFTSDALRRPLTPRLGSVTFDGGPAQPLRWESQRMVAAAAHGAREAVVAVELTDGTRLSHRFALPEP